MTAPHAHLVLAVTMIMFAGGMPVVAQQDIDPLMTFAAELDFGSDAGQNFGTIFEATAEDGSLTIGAGFVGAYNTRLRSDRYSVQLFVRPNHERPEMTFEQLPRPSQMAGTYIFSRRGVLYARDRGDGVVRMWDEEAGRWQIAADSLQDWTSVADGTLVFGRSRASYGRNGVLEPPAEGSYYGFYYGPGASEDRGYLCFYHTDRAGQSGYREYESDATGFSKLYACPWKPGDGSIDVGEAVVKTLPVVGETPFAWGQLDGELITCSNIGGIYTFDGQRWKTLIEPIIGTSYQIYTMINVYDRLLMGQYPTGELFAYDGENVTHLNGQPPKLEAVSGSAREAQTAALYGGDLWMGVWPWAELWRFSTDTERWYSEGRMFSHPELTDDTVHPYQNQADAHGSVLNQWGQRVTALVPLGNSLYISTSAKWPCDYEPEGAFLTEQQREEYGRVLRMHLPGTLSVPLAYSADPTTLEFTIHTDHISISQDGTEIGSAPLDDAMAAALTDVTIGETSWGDGLFGTFGGASLEGRCRSE